MFSQVIKLQNIVRAPIGCMGDRGKQKPPKNSNNNTRASDHAKPITSEFVGTGPGYPCVIKFSVMLVYSRG